MRKADSMGEARRALRVCNACGYCNGFCDLFDAAKRRPALQDADLKHLASLCHACRNCLYACQYAAPHPFNVNLPRSLARARQQSFADDAWPKPLSGLFQRSLLTASSVTVGAILIMWLLVMLSASGEQLFARSAEPGAFYRMLPWEAMVLVGVLPLGWALVAMSISLRRYWLQTRSTNASVTPLAVFGALWKVIAMRNLSGGGPGCKELGSRLSHARRWLHQLMVGGVLLSFSATLVATYYEHIRGLQAPYPLTSLPVILGSLGGIAMVIGITGLLWLKRHADSAATCPEAQTADIALLAQLLAVAISGLALLAWRETPAMSLLLATHLGCVFALFLLAPYGKLVHAGYRVLSLLTDAIERKADRKR